MPERIRLRRTKGWRKPDGVLVVSRPSAWGNPFPVGGDVPDRAHSVALYEQHVAADPELRARARAELRGRDLACWCPTDGPCHADVLLRVANSDPE